MPEQPAAPAPRVRLARITDVAALAEISRRAYDAALEEPSSIRSLGLPLAPAALSLYQLFRMPLSLIRSSDAIWVHQRGPNLDGLARVERDPHGEWTTVELAAADDASRARLLARVIREAGRHGVPRIHVACREDAATLALIGSAGFQVYARETLYALQPSRAAALSDRARARESTARLRPVQPRDAVLLAQLAARVTPPAVARVERIDARDWERATRGAWVPRASISPLLRLVEGDAFVVDGDAGELDGWVHIGVAREPDDQHPHVMQVTALSSVDVGPIIAAALEVIAERASGAGTANSAILAAVRTYESEVGAALRAHGFEEIADLRLAVRDARARISAPGMVPAIG